MRVRQRHGRNDPNTVAPERVGDIQDRPVGRSDLYPEFAVCFEGLPAIWRVLRYVTAWHFRVQLPSNFPWETIHLVPVAHAASKPLSFYANLTEVLHPVLVAYRQTG